MMSHFNFFFFLIFFNFEKDFYELLGCDDINDIKIAIKHHRSLSRYFHPGKFFLLLYK
jgi:hypothetical protein